MDIRFDRSASIYTEKTMLRLPAKNTFEKRDK